MMEKSPRWCDLNAYVDGELDARKAADVALAAGMTPDTADHIALLYHLKGGSHAAFPQAPADLKSVLPPEQPARARAAIAGLCLALVSAAMLVTLQLWPLTEITAGRELFASALQIHRQWLADDVSKTREEPHVTLAALTRFGQLPVVPDLESTGLNVALVSVADVGNGRILQVGYRGHHGCHLSLFVFTGGLLPHVDTTGLATGERASAWQTGDLGYLLLAKGMDVARFDLIAEEVEHATRVKAPLDARATQELADNKRQSASCNA